MPNSFRIPEEYEIPFRRILPYLSAPLQKDHKVMESLVLYFKLGGEKMARIVIDALNVTHRIQYAELVRKMREEAMSRENLNEDDEDDEDADDIDGIEEEDDGDSDSDNH